MTKQETQKVNRVKTFDQLFALDIEHMKTYLANTGLRMISFQNEDGWNFKLSISQKNFNKLNNMEKK